MNGFTITSGNCNGTCLIAQINPLALDEIKTKLSQYDTKERRGQEAQVSPNNNIKELQDEWQFSVNPAKNPVIFWAAEIGYQQLGMRPQTGHQLQAEFLGSLDRPYGIPTFRDLFEGKCSKVLIHWLTFRGSLPPALRDLDSDMPYCPWLIRNSFVGYGKSLRELLVAVAPTIP